MEIRDIMLKINPDSVVIMINGKYKCVWFNKDGHMIQIPLAESGEVSDDIFDFFKRVRTRSPTPKIFNRSSGGIGMGQTLTSERLGNFSPQYFI